MGETTTMLSQPMQQFLERLTSDGIAHSAEGLSGMVNESVSVSNLSVKVVPFKEVPAMFGGPESEAVGIYLRSEGDVSIQFMLAIPYEKALELADLLMGEKLGTTKQLDSMERSALAEVGNLTTAFFLTTVADKIGLHARPTPPAVMVDMIGAIIDIVIATIGVVDDVTVFHGTLTRKNGDTQAEYWLIPDPATLEAICKKAG